MPQEVIVFGPEWERVKAALLKVEATLEKQLEKDVKELAEKYADEARAKVQALPTPSNAGHTGLRNRVAAGVKVVDNAAAGVRITTSMVNASERSIPLGLDSPGTGWRHPLFGNKNYWFRNEGYSWFRETFSDAQDAFERELHNTLEKAADSVG